MLKISQEMLLSANPRQSDNEPEKYVRCALTGLVRNCKLVHYNFDEYFYHAVWVNTPFVDSMIE